MLTHGGGGETVYKTGRTRKPKDTLHLLTLSSLPPNSWFTLFLPLPFFGSSFTHCLIEPQKSKDFPVSKTIINERHKQSNFQESPKVLQQYQHFPEKGFFAIIGQHWESWLLENYRRKYAVINGVNIWAWRLSVQSIRLLQNKNKRQRTPLTSVTKVFHSQLSQKGVESFVLVLGMWNCRPRAFTKHFSPGGWRDEISARSC